MCFEDQNRRGHSAGISYDKIHTTLKSLCTSLRGMNKTLAFFENLSDDGFRSIPVHVTLVHLMMTSPRKILAWMKSMKFTLGILRFSTGNFFTANLSLLTFSRVSSLK
jgi:hypothetical protein